MGALPTQLSKILKFHNSPFRYAKGIILANRSIVILIIEVVSFVIRISSLIRLSRHGLAVTDHSSFVIRHFLTHHSPLTTILNRILPAPPLHLFLLGFSPAPSYVKSLLHTLLKTYANYLLIHSLGNLQIPSHFSRCYKLCPETFGQWQ